jgi:hypothetical protein
MSLHDEAQRGALAKLVLENPVYASSYDLIEREVMHAWRDSRDPVEREDLHTFLKALAKARSFLEATMRSGEVATAQLQREQSRAERMLTGWQRKAS